jgi:hypothetical protein
MKHATDGLRRVQGEAGVACKKKRKKGVKKPV